jgi:beta-galactosidase
VWSIGNEIQGAERQHRHKHRARTGGYCRSTGQNPAGNLSIKRCRPEKNFIYQSNALDLVGLNYHPEVYAGFQKNYPGQKFIGTEQMSALAKAGDFMISQQIPHAFGHKVQKRNIQRVIPKWQLPLMIT